MKPPGKDMLTVAVLASACALSGNAAEQTRVVNEGGIRDQWMLADGVTLAAPGYPAAFAGRGDNVCVAVGYSIRADGTTSDFTLFKAWASSTADTEPVEGFWDAFAQTSAGALSQWRFKPRPEVSNPQPVYTVATMHFMGKHATDAAELRRHCEISDLPTLVKSHRGRLNKADRSTESRMQSLRNTQGTPIIENPATGR